MERSRRDTNVCKVKRGSRGGRVENREFKRLLPQPPSPPFSPPAAPDHQCVTTGVPMLAQLNNQAASEVRMFTQPWLIGRPKLWCQ